MAIPFGKTALTLERLSKLLDPGRVFYRVAVEDILQRGELAEIQVMIRGRARRQGQVWRH